ncbi:MAG: TldD/PmbA family protein [Candidatus Hodarchaeota archaeon]
MLGDDMMAIELKRTEQSNYTIIKIMKGKIEETTVGVEAGCGIRVLVDGVYGFAFGPIDQERQIREMAIKTAKASKSFVKESVQLPEDLPTHQDTEKIIGSKPLLDYSFEDKVNLALECDKNMEGELIKARSTTYHEIIRRVTIETSWGTKIESERPYVMLYSSATAKYSDKTSEGRTRTGHIGGFEIFDRDPPATVAQKAREKAEKGVKIQRIKPGRYSVVLGGELNHLFAHEAAGHPNEADTARVRSVLRGKLGKKIAASNVNLVDDALLEQVNGIRTFGFMKYDDEGTPGQRTEIIKDGILQTYMTDLATAQYWGLKPTGNARAQFYSSIPMVRMTNTFIEAEKDPLSREEVLETVKNGFLLKSGGGGQVDSIRGTFNFGCDEVYQIVNGEIGERYSPTTLTGNTLATLKAIMGISNEKEDPPSSIGFCGKGTKPQSIPNGTSGGWFAVKSILIGG